MEHYVGWCIDKPHEYRLKMTLWYRRIKATVPKELIALSGAL